MRLIRRLLGIDDAHDLRRREFDLADTLADLRYDTALSATDEAERRLRVLDARLEVLDVRRRRRR